MSPARARRHAAERPAIPPPTIAVPTRSVRTAGTREEVPAAQEVAEGDVRPDDLAVEGEGLDVRACARRQGRGEGRERGDADERRDRVAPRQSKRFHSRS